MIPKLTNLQVNKSINLNANLVEQKDKLKSIMITVTLTIEANDIAMKQLNYLSCTNTLKEHNWNNDLLNVIIKTLNNDIECPLTLDELKYNNKLPLNQNKLEDWSFIIHKEEKKHYMIPYKTKELIEHMAKYPTESITKKNFAECQILSFNDLITLKSSIENIFSYEKLEKRNNELEQLKVELAIQINELKSKLKAHKEPDGLWGWFSNSCYKRG